MEGYGKLRSLSESIQFGEKLIGDLIKEKGLETKHVVVIALYKELLEKVDGLFVLADTNSEKSTTVLSRSIYETYLSLSYILKEKSKIETRANCYYIGYIKVELDEAKRALKRGSTIKSPEIINVTIEQANKILKTPKYNSIIEEWERTKRKLNEKSKKYHEPKWYSLFNGPENLRQLIKRIDENDNYDYYRMLSLEVHGYLALESIISNGKSILMKPIRNVDGKFKEDIASAFLISATFKVINSLFPQYLETFKEFYKEIKPVNRN